jgi:hypothetical protein
MGGHGAMYLSTRHPDLFGSCGNHERGNGHELYKIYP